MLINPVGQIKKEGRKTKPYEVAKDPGSPFRDCQDVGLYHSFLGAPNFSFDENHPFPPASRKTAKASAASVMSGRPCIRDFFLL